MHAKFSGKKERFLHQCSFFGKFDMLCFLVTPVSKTMLLKEFLVRLLTKLSLMQMELLTTKYTYQENKTISKIETCV